MSCEFSVTCKKVSDEEWTIISLSPHTCTKLQRLTNKNANAVFIVEHPFFIEEVNLNRSYNASNLFTDFKMIYRVEIESYTVRWKSVTLLKKRLFGNVEESFVLLNTYKKELLDANPGSVFHVEDNEGPLYLLEAETCGTIGKDP
ncbi:hypothetical protein P9112_006331 [Eukaryota sp. TZLM1-RC]